MSAKFCKECGSKFHYSNQSQTVCSECDSSQPVVASAPVFQQQTAQQAQLFQASEQDKPAQRYQLEVKPAETSIDDIRASFMNDLSVTARNTQHLGPQKLKAEDVIASAPNASFQKGKRPNAFQGKDPLDVMREIGTKSRIEETD